jgi:carnitine O-palmitoyltransferase 1
MAEAHSAVAFSFSITHEGWDVNFDREVLHLVWQSGVRSWKKRLARFKVKILQAYVWKYLDLQYRSATAGQF